MRLRLSSKESSPYPLLGLLLLCSPSACSRPDRSAPSASSPTAAPVLADPQLDRGLGQLHATFGLLQRAHAKKSTAEASRRTAEPTKEQLLAHAHRLFADIAPALLVRHPGVHRILARVLKQLPAALEPEHPLQAGRTILADALQGLERLLDKKLAPTTQGARDAVAAADSLLVTEEIVGDYRLGIATTPPQTQYLPVTTGQLEVKPSMGTTHYLIITVRERPSKRHLPRAAVSLRVGKEQRVAISLVESWGPFMHYGANLLFKPGQKLHFKVGAGPLNYKRYEALRGAFTKPVEWVVEATAEPGGALRLEAPPSKATPATAPIGEDLLQAHTRVGDTEEAGAYRLGLLSGSARPMWRLTAEGTEPVPQRRGGQQQLEVVLFDNLTGRSITGARIVLLLASAAQDTPRRVRLHPVMGSFYRYAGSLTVPAGSYSIQAEIQAPSFATLTPQRFPHRQRVELSQKWRVAPAANPQAKTRADAGGPGTDSASLAPGKATPPSP